MIRKARKQDLNNIYDLIQIGSVKGQVLLRSKKELESVLKYFFVAHEGEKIIGCISLEIYSPRLAEVRSLVVLKEYRKMGLGGRLVKRCIKEARKEGVYEILSITDRIDFFNRFGFFNKLSGQSPLFKKLLSKRPLSKRLKKG